MFSWRRRGGAEREGGGQMEGERREEQGTEVVRWKVGKRWPDFKEAAD